ncbi:hypothetical protein GCM10017557_81350 [Streptomyces aurantiacus]|uniref:Uncharacterized protein n=1 Tax=Streptomyces aurantiacus TaxID=47760 RepID=A0A7G1PH43_9ACTN|nr:hypothetical protein GCM10017557_81350 [Streptomyces aurantiacus]
MIDAGGSNEVPVRVNEVPFRVSGPGRTARRITEGTEVTVRGARHGEAAGIRGEAAVPVARERVRAAGRAARARDDRGRAGIWKILVLRRRKEGRHCPVASRLRTARTASTVR